MESTKQQGIMVYFNKKDRTKTSEQIIFKTEMKLVLVGLL